MNTNNNTTYPTNSRQLQAELARLEKAGVPLLDRAEFAIAFLERQKKTAQNAEPTGPDIEHEQFTDEPQPGPCVGDASPCVGDASEPVGEASPPASDPFPFTRRSEYFEAAFDLRCYMDKRSPLDELPANQQ